jgi:orotidine-5'-phosphate decarboxylase
MSHKGASEGYGQTIINSEKGEKTMQYISFAKKALKLEADGAVVGATYPEKIRQVHEILGEKVPIYSPGIGAQGGEIAAALKSGAHYLIVGRSIVQAENPSKSAKEIQALAQIG